EGLQRIKAIGGTAIAIRADISDPDYDKAKIVKQIEDAFGRSPDILVHSAAAPREWGTDWRTPFAETPFDMFIAGVKTNVWGGWDMSKAVIPGMREKGAGWIVFISSQQAAPRPHPESGSGYGMGGASIYGGTKAFIDRVVTGAASELYQDNIAVNSLAPTGAVSTPLSRSVGVSAEGTEPMETFVEATLALCCAEPKSLTSRVVHTLPLLAELNRPVYTIDGKQLFDRWQAGNEDPRKEIKNYLAAYGH
ncbi:MAG: SDR family oxidoreductase, partial [Dehalococcoidia bacterium]|nr:SDR family oxidoreductase [Dehalococcoidia bacterium]